MSCHYTWSLTLELALSKPLTGYQPDFDRVAPEEWSVCGPSVLTTATAVGPTSPEEAAGIMSILTHAAVFHLREGLGCDPAVWVLEESINRFVLNQPSLKPSSIRTYRSTLRRVRDALVWMNLGEAPPVPFSAPQIPSEPYSTRELVKLHSWAKALPTAYQRRCALTLLALGAGCGLASDEIGQLRGRDVQILDSGAVVVEPPGSNRVVACRAAWEEDLASLARITRGDQHFFAPQRQVDKPANLIGNILGKLPRTAGVPRPDSRRMRSTWLVDLMRAFLPHEVIAKAAGLASSQQLARYARWVPEIDQSAALRMMRGLA